jgi:hypothetical protein
MLGNSSVDGDDDIGLERVRDVGISLYKRVC